VSGVGCVGEAESGSGRRKRKEGFRFEHLREFGFLMGGGSRMEGGGMGQEGAETLPPAHATTTAQVIEEGQEGGGMEDDGEEVDLDSDSSDPGTSRAQVKAQSSNPSPLNEERSNIEL
jgi:hypothetical protein